MRMCMAFFCLMACLRSSRSVLSSVGVGAPPASDRALLGASALALLAAVAAAREVALLLELVLVLVLLLLLLGKNVAMAWGLFKVRRPEGVEGTLLAPASVSAARRAVENSLPDASMLKLGANTGARAGGRSEEAAAAAAAAAAAIAMELGCRLSRSCFCSECSPEESLTLLPPLRGEGLMDRLVLVRAERGCLREGGVGGRANDAGCFEGNKSAGSSSA